jgi:hypothetical protein
VSQDSKRVSPSRASLPLKQGALIDFDPEVAGASVCDYIAWIVVGAKALPDEFVEAELLRACHFDDAVHRSAHSNLSNSCGDIFCGHGLDEHWRQSNVRAVAGSISDIFNEFEELGCVND